ncbi:MAG TPA: hypothetical protein VGC19_14520 [Rhodanobacter sp.]
MHLELPKLPMANFKDFAKHYLMIVLSILTALGLEAWIEHAHHAHAAASASQQIETELRANLDDLHEATRINQSRLAPLRQLDAAITGDIRKGLPRAAINEHIQAMKKQFMLSLNWPAFNTQAWDVAVANQSATWINPANLRRYSMAYAAQRSAGEWMTHDSTVALNTPRMAALRTELDLGVAVDPVEFVSVLREMVNTMNETQAHLAQTQTSLLNALPGNAGNAASAP